MKNLFLIFRILVIASTVLISSCKEEIIQPIPDIQPGLTKGKYNKYKDLLEEAYATENYFNAAVQLANLKGNVSETYNMLKIGVKKKPSECDRVFEWYWLYDKHNFGTNILMHDSVEFKKVLTLCNKINKAETYNEYAIRKDQEERHSRENKPVEDSTNFDLELVAELKEIYNADQSIRIKSSAKSISPKKKDSLRIEMRKIDSINLKKIDRIFEKHGYPSRELVGKNGNFTPALVIHHSNSLETRYKYLPILEKAVKDGVLYEGTLEMIKKRILDIELDDAI